MPDWKEWGSTLDAREPIYLQIVDRFRSSMIKQEILLGDRIPSIRDLAIAMKVNPNTVNRAYLEMERTGLIVSQRGVGYFVAKDVENLQMIKKEMASTVSGRYIEDMHVLGFSSDEIVYTLTAQIAIAEKERERDHE